MDSRMEQADLLDATEGSLVEFLRADERDLARTALADLPIARSGFMRSNSTLRGLGDRWNMHRSGRFGWHRSWKGKDRFQDIANLAWPATASVLRWNGASYRVPRYAAYRVIASEVLRALRQRASAAACFHVAFNPLVALIAASRMPHLLVEIAAFSRLGLLEINRFLELQLLPSYVLDFVPQPVLGPSAHRAIRMLDSAATTPHADRLTVHIHDLCAHSESPGLVPADRAGGPRLVIAPRDLMRRSSDHRTLFELDGRDFCLACSD